MKAERLKAALESFIREVWGPGGRPSGRALTRRGLHDPPRPRRSVGGAHAGRGRLQGARPPVAGPVPDQKFDVQRLCADGDAVAMTWLWRATHLGDVPGFPATGETLRMSGATTYLFTADDKLSGHWQITDRLGIGAN